MHALTIAAFLCYAAAVVCAAIKRTDISTALIAAGLAFQVAYPTFQG